MTELKAEVDPGEVGFDPERLQRIDRHFARYVEDRRLPGWLITVSRHGRLAHVSSCGSRDIEAGLAVETDTLWRICSMTKPVTSVAAMMLYEEGAFELTDPVSRFIPSFADVRVYAGGSDLRQVTVPATEPVRIWHLLTHTAGLTYGFHRVHPVDALHRDAGFEWSYPPGCDLAQACDIWAGLPLLFQPGAEWNYSVATDVLGGVVEVASGQRLDDFFAQRIFGPLGMTDTTFYVAADDTRLAALYQPGPEGRDAAGRAGPGRAAAAGHAQRRRGPDLDRGRLPPLHPDGAGPRGQPGRRTGRRPAAEPAHRRLHGPESPARRARPGDVRPPAVRRGGLENGYHFHPIRFSAACSRIFGLGTGYLIYGPQELVHWPPRDESVDRTTGVWGIWMPGFCQLVAGIILFIGLTWLQVFTSEPPLYMTALAFSAYGIHWFALGWGRYRGSDPRPNAGMCVAFMVISAMGATVFFKVGDWPVGLLFLGLFAVYFSEFFGTLGLRLGERALGFFHIVTGLWLMYLAYAVAVDFAIGYHWRI